MKNFLDFLGFSEKLELYGFEKVSCFEDFFELGIDDVKGMTH